MATLTTNPFDDSFEETHATNPFSPGRNPFDQDDHEDGGALLAATSQDDTDHNENAKEDEPPEASWQYLGDLPYRRIPIYSNVRWSPAEANNSNNTTHSNHNWWYQGLSRYPQVAASNATMTARERRQWIQTSSHTHVTGCPHGGCLATITVPQTSSHNNNTAWRRQSTLRCLTNAGQLLAAVAIPPDPWHHAYTAADVMTMGFTSRSILIIILRDSLVLTYTLAGQPVLDPFYILPTGEQQGGANLLAAHIYEGGVAVLSQGKQVALCELLDYTHDDGGHYIATAHGTARVVRADTSGTTTTTHSTESGPYALVTEIPLAHRTAHTNLRALAVLPRHRTKSQHPEIFVSTTHPPSVWVLEAATLTVTDVQASLVAPILKMALAPNGRFLACFTQDAMVTVVSTSFDTKVLDFDTSEGATTPPLALEWCGEDSVVLHWKNMGILMVGPYGDWLRFPYPQTESLYLVAEMDCCRVLTDSAVEILQRVPPTTAAMLRIGSIEPSAMLVDAADRFAAGTLPFAVDDTAKSMRQSGQLETAIAACTEAALREFDIVTQKRLLAAASYGMHYSYKSDDDEQRVLGGGSNGEGNADTSHNTNQHIWPSATTREFVATARKLRVLNALRNPQVGFVLTASQWEALTPTGIVARLVAMQRPALATSISQYLRLPRSVQLYCRACQAAAVVQAAPADASDADTAEKALQILHGGTATAATRASYRGGYATIAMSANQSGHPGVANLLLMMETSVADKVPALLATGAYPDAVAVASQAKDQDFIMVGLLALAQSLVKTATTAAEVTKAKSNFMGALVAKYTPESFHTWRQYLEGQGDVKQITNLHLRAQNFADAGATLALRALSEPDTRERRGMLEESSRIFGLGKETTFAKSCTDDYLELLKDQEVLRNMYGSNDVAPESTSVTSTIASVLKFAAVQQREQHRLLSDADKLAKKFRVPEKRLWHVKVNAFADSAQWSNLRLLSDSRAKPPIGLKPFVRAVIRGGQPTSEITRYLERLPTPEERYDMYCEANLWKQALEEATKLCDGQRILNVKTLCSSSEIQLLADQALGRLA